MESENEKPKVKVIAKNRRASHDYHLMDRLEAGMVLEGTEVKSLRDGRATLSDCYARVEDNEIFVHNLDIPPYTHGTHNNHEPKRPRKLLLHKKEIKKLRTIVTERGLTIIPTRIYFKSGYAKLELSIAKGKSHGDKRHDLKKKDHEREMARYR